VQLHRKSLLAVTLKMSNSYMENCLPPQVASWQKKKRELIPGLPVAWKAILAIDGSALRRLKRDFTIFSAV
jgi:hypothetical protein